MVTDPSLPDDVRAVLVWADMAMADVRSKVMAHAGEPAYVIVPTGARELDVYTRAEAHLIACGMRLDFRHHPDELVRRTVADTLRLVSWWFPQEQHELLTGPAKEVAGWPGHAFDGMTCPLCQQAKCDPGDCPMRRVGNRPMFAAPAVTYLLGKQQP